MAVTKEEYNRKLQEELARVNNDRDEAVRATNIALGYGNSTALQFDVPDHEVPTAQPKDAG
jgi:hypothetical protein